MNGVFLHVYLWQKTDEHRLITEYEAMLACPICSGPMQLMQMANTGSLRCSRGHCFDIAKQGYVNLLPHPPRGTYDKSMFEARRRVSASGFFEPLLERINGRISRELPSMRNRRICWMQAAGRLRFSRIVQLARERTSAKLLGIGVDISKEAIRIRGKRIIAGDMVRCGSGPVPFRQSDLQLHPGTVLSPSNYAEFRRLLSDDGMVIKVIPGSGLYARAQRGCCIGRRTDSTTIMSVRPALFGPSFSSDRDRVGAVSPPGWPRIPGGCDPNDALVLGAPEERIRQALHMENAEITADFTILYGRNK